MAHTFIIVPPLQMTEVMGLLTEVTSRPWHIQACSAKTGEGLDDG